MRAVGEANKYFSEQAPWKLRTEDPERMKTVLHVTLQAVADAKTLLTPFLPRSSQAVHEMLGGTGEWSGMPRIETVDEEGGPSYPVITGDYDSTFRWESRPVAAGTPLAVPAPLFTKLDQSVVDEEIARLAAMNSPNGGVASPEPPRPRLRPGDVRCRIRAASTRTPTWTSSGCRSTACSTAARAARHQPGGQRRLRPAVVALVGVGADEYPDVYAAVAIHPNETRRGVPGA